MCSSDLVLPDWRALAADPQVEVVDVAVPPDVQPAIIEGIVALVERGGSRVRGILAQKPLACDYAGAAALVRRCREAGVRLVVNQNMRYDHAVRACGDLLARGVLGTPVLATVFSPLTIANKLSNGKHRAHLASHPDAVMAGLEIITQATCAFARETIQSGCAGIFFATQDATSQLFDATTYKRVTEAFDHRVLNAAREAGGWFNVLHKIGRAHV